MLTNTPMSKTLPSVVHTPSYPLLFVSYAKFTAISGHWVFGAPNWLHRRWLPEAEPTISGYTKNVWLKSWRSNPGRGRVLVRYTSRAGVCETYTNRTSSPATFPILRRRKRSHPVVFPSRTTQARNLRTKRSCFLLFRVSMPLRQTGILCASKLTRPTDPQALLLQVVPSSINPAIFKTYPRSNRKASISSQSSLSTTLLSWALGARPMASKETILYGGSATGQKR